MDFIFYENKRGVSVGRKSIYNNIATEEKMEKVNPKNLALLEEWKIYLRTVNRSPKTIKNYASDMNIFFVWLLDFKENKFFVDITKKDVLFFQDYAMNTLGLGSCRVRRLKDTLSSFSNYIEGFCDEDYPNFRNIIRKIESPGKKAVREKTVFEEEDIEMILNGLLDRGYYQIACLVALACYSGSRRSELLEFKVDYFEPENVVFGSLFKTPETIKTKGRDGGKYIYKYTLKKPFERYYYLWMKERRKLLKGEQIDPEVEQYLFIHKVKGKWERLQSKSLTWGSDVVNKILEEEGNSKIFYWHACRHYWCTALLKSGLPADVVKEIGQWSDMSLVEIYDDRDKSLELGKYFDENGIKNVEAAKLSDL